MSDETSREVSRLWRILRTVRQMCADRGYELSEEEVNISLEDFRSQYADIHGNVEKARLAFTVRPTQAMLDKYTALPKPGSNDIPEPQIGTCHVEFYQGASMGIKHLKEFSHTLDKQKYWTGILITPIMPTSTAMKIIPGLKPIELEVFKEEDLLVNISRHELVPKHILLSPGEKRYLLDRYRLKETQLPRIRQDDPVSKYLGLRRGQVVKIIRKSETAGRYASYRYVI